MCSCVDWGTYSLASVELSLFFPFIIYFVSFRLFSLFSFLFFSFLVERRLNKFEKRGQEQLSETIHTRKERNQPRDIVHTGQMVGLY
jgi:hypothetical protein